MTEVNSRPNEDRLGDDFKSIVGLRRADFDATFVKLVNCRTTVRRLLSPFRIDSQLDLFHLWVSFVQTWRIVEQLVDLGMTLD